MKRVKISIAQPLVNLYEVSHTSIESLARRFNVSTATISNRLHEYGLLCTHDHSIHSVEPDRIKRLMKVVIVQLVLLI